MSIISSKQQKRQSIVDPNLILMVLLLVLALLLIAPLGGNTYDFFGQALGSVGIPPAGLKASQKVSFASDLSYWNAYCSRGWTTDAGCESIEARTQSCSIGGESAYCKAYESYLQQYRNR